MPRIPGNDRQRRLDSYGRTAGTLSYLGVKGTLCRIVAETIFVTTWFYVPPLNGHIIGNTAVKVLNGKVGRLSSCKSPARLTARIGMANRLANRLANRTDEDSLQPAPDGERIAQA